MRIKIIPGIICLLLLANCVRHQEVDTDVNVIKAHSGNKTKLSELFDEVAIVPLETTSQGLVGVGALKVEVFGEKVFVLNQLASHCNILCFDTSGKFLFVIDEIGNGPGEYTYLGDFLIDHGKEEIILCSEQGRFFRFNMSGEFIAETQTSDVYYSRQMCIVNDSTLVAFNDQSTLPKGIDLLTINYKTFDVEKESPAHSMLSGAMEPRLPISVHDDNILFYDATDTIFDISDISNRVAKYVLDFGDTQREGREIIQNEMQVGSYEAGANKGLELFLTQQYVICPALFENNRFIAIGYMEQAVVSEKPDARYSFVLYDKESGESYNSGDMAFDMLNLSDMGNVNILGRSGDALYAIYEPRWTDKEKKRLLEKKSVPENIKQYVRAGEGNNPLLVILR